MVLIVLAFVPHLEFAISLVGCFELPPSSWCCVCVTCSSSPVQCYTKVLWGISVLQVHSIPTTLVATFWPLCSADETPRLASCQDSARRLCFCSSVSVPPVPLQFVVRLLGSRVLGCDAQVVCVYETPRSV